VDAIHEARITEQTSDRCRKQNGGMETHQLKEPKRLQKENERLRKAVSDLTLDKLIHTKAALEVRAVQETVQWTVSGPDGRSP